LPERERKGKKVSERKREGRRIETRRGDEGTNLSWPSRRR